MLGWIVKLLGMRALKKAVHGGSRPPILDFGLGFALLRDRRVPVVSKLLALMLGVVALIALTALELPVELIVAALLNVPGIGMDLVVDGIEVIAGPLLFGSLFLIRLAPRHLIDQIRAERNGITFSPAPTAIAHS